MDIFKNEALNEARKASISMFGTDFDRHVSKITSKKRSFQTLLGGNFLQDYRKKSLSDNMKEQIRYDLFLARVLRLEKGLDKSSNLLKGLCRMSEQERIQFRVDFESIKQVVSKWDSSEKNVESEIPNLIADYDSESDDDADSVSEDNYNSDTSKFEDFIDVLLSDKHENGKLKSIRKIRAIKRVDFSVTPFDGDTTNYLFLIEKIRSKLLENSKTANLGIEFLLTDYPVSANDENIVVLPDKFILLNVPAILMVGTPAAKKDNLELI